MWTMIDTLPGQYRWAAELAIPPIAAASTVLVCGMGGSGISGDLVQTVAAVDGVDIRVHKDYGLPAWARAVRPLVIAVSYSGNTAETLSSIEVAIELGLPVAIVTTGGELSRVAEAERYPVVVIPDGLQPRAALGYLAGAVLRLAASATPIHAPVPMLMEAAETIADLLGVDHLGEAHVRAREIAARLEGRLPVIWGSTGPTASVAQRWAKQLNENAKLPAYFSMVPELCHNELVPWAFSRNEFRESTGIVLLRDCGERPEIARRFELMADLIGDNASVVGEVWTVGESVLARIATGALIGDLVSVYLAESTGVDPIPVDVLTELKNRL